MNIKTTEQLTVTMELTVDIYSVGKPLEFWNLCSQKDLPYHLGYNCLLIGSIMCNSFSKVGGC